MTEFNPSPSNDSEKEEIFIYGQIDNKKNESEPEYITNVVNGEIYYSGYNYNYKENNTGKKKKENNKSSNTSNKRTKILNVPSLPNGYSNINDTQESTVQKYESNNNLNSLEIINQNEYTSDQDSNSLKENSITKRNKDNEHYNRKYTSKVNVGRFQDFIPQEIGFNQSIDGSIREAERKNMKSRIRIHDHAKERATVDNVIDPKTRMILYKMINKGTISVIRGCVSSGKEANVYYAEGPEGEPYAVKIYKTSILSFKDRERYVSGEYRFRNAYAKSNSRKMVRLWAEKEMRNYKRLEEIGLRVPKVFLLRGHVLLMEFIGKDGWPAKRLHDAVLRERTLRKLYLQLIKDIRNMYQNANLVHGDLSEYNILYFNKNAYIIDVSQAVSNDHPNALEFLRSDCENIKIYFRNRGISNVMTTRELFEFATDPTLKDNQVDQYLKKMMEKINDRVLTEEDDKEDAIFKTVYIPRNVKDIPMETIERHQKELETGIENPDQLFYRTVSGMTTDMTGLKTIPDILEGEELEENESNSESNEDEMSNKAIDLGIQLKNMDKKERKDFVKMMKKEKRKTKIPKKVKKRQKTLAMKNKQ